jgi:ParB family chromosome partitioning protein
LLDADAAASTAEGRRAAGVLEAPIEKVRPNPEQPRKTFRPEELEELAASIREKGVLQPILARPAPGEPGVYQIIAGERRWRAAQKAELHTIPVLVRDLADHEVMEVALIENIQRADLNALEEARAYGMMTERFGHSPEAIARVVGKSRSHVANTLRLTRLPPTVQAHVEEGRLSAGHARALLDLDDAPALAERIIAQGLNVRQTEALARSAGKTGGRGGKARVPATKDADTRALEADLEDMLGLKVEILDHDGAGEVRLFYETLEQLDEVCSRLSRRAGGD